MLDIHFILKNKDIILDCLKNRNKEGVDIGLLENLYKERSRLISLVDDLRNRRKKAAEERNDEEGKKIKKELAENEPVLREKTKALQNLMAKIPNIPLPDVPIGKDEDENVVLRQEGERPVFTFKPLPHWELGSKLGIIDSERAAKVSGSRFTYLRGKLALLQFALINFTLDMVTDEKTVSYLIDKHKLSLDSKAYTPIIPPVFITPKAFHGMARLEPKEDRYYIETDDLYLIGSAEHTLGAMYMDETFDEKDLPKRYIGYSTAFRREAGSYGKDTKGILRQHQFDKLEFEVFSKPENSKQEQDLLVAMQEYLMQKLGLSYQVVAICTGDMGDPDMRQIDIETWMPGQGVYRETHSADLIGEYQARRLNIKLKRGDSTKEYLHMNDATCFAIGRTLIAILENYQREDGKVDIPEALVPYTKFSVIE